MFVAIGLVGVALFLLAYLADSILDGVIEGLLPDSEWLSLSAVATLVTAFGFGAAVLQWRFDAPIPVAAAGGLALGVGLAGVSVRWSRALRDMPTDATPSADDLLGRPGRVVTPVPAGSSGEVLVTLGGQPVKLSAVGPLAGSAELARGADIVVVEVLSPTRVRVEASDAFWH
jgi:membrane protein implicated in regulation of membrane protease activity